MLTPKPNGSWRFAIDYRPINKYTKPSRAPIPHIKRLLTKIGAHKPKFFAKMDLTSGFYQTPLEEESMKYTAFDTDLGLFEFTRASMGLLNSPWYFQSIMEREVFPTLIHRIMEIYIDDLLTWAKDIDELCENLKKIFQCLRDKGMTLNPEKCEFGLSEVEFVGHLIDETGITFAKDKIKQVADMPVPTTKGELKRFLGLGGYFRNHVEDYAHLTGPLNAMLQGYEKRASKEIINWTPSQIEIFNTCQKAIINCRKLYYQHPGAPIRVYTDASDYGIGAYLCQVMTEGEEIPIEFISKTLTIAERKWSTYEKEAFAIFYALRKWEHFLKDVTFTLFTDHKNLTYIATDPNAKVTRWRMAVQDYDFDIAYIPGEENLVADALSRLCLKEDPKEDRKIERARQSIHALLTTTLFDEWEPVREQFPEKEHTEYYIQSEDLEKFQHLNVNTAYINALTDRTIPKDFKYIPPDKFKIIEQCHNHEVGHWGVNRTIEMVKTLIELDPKYENIQWNCMRKDVQTYILRCDCCNKMNERQLTSHVKKYTTSEYGVMKCIAIDAIHMPKAKSGNKYILTVIDTFTRYTALYALKELTAKTAAKTLMNHMCIYGIPDKITADNATQFQAEFKEMLSILETENYKIHAYSHQENGLVERANKEVIRHARNIAYETRNADTWDEEILKIQAIMNDKKSEATGLSPNQIVFVGQINLQEGRLYPQPTEKQRKSMSKYMTEQIDFQDKLMKMAEEQQEKINSLHLQNSKDTEIQYHTGQYIIVQYENGKTPHKLSAKWHGPYRIIEVHKRPQGTIYTCYSPKDGKVAEYHASIVLGHACKSDLEAVKSAVRDDDKHYIVEKVLAHEIVQVNGKNTLNVKIQWHGYKEPEWTNIRTAINNIYVQRYLKDNNLEQYGGMKRTADDNIDTRKRKRVRFSSSVPEDHIT